LASWLQVWRLSTPERWLLAKALALLPITAAALRVGGFRRTYAALARLAPKQATRAAPGGPALIQEAWTIARIVDAAARRGPCRAMCLSRSLALWWLLRRRGIEADLRIGVRKHDDRLEAHAWVELQGHVLNDGADVGEHFAPFGRAILPAGVAL
jgi:hypothetical protein